MYVQSAGELISSHTCLVVIGPVVGGAGQAGGVVVQVAPLPALVANPAAGLQLLAVHQITLQTHQQLLSLTHYCFTATIVTE